MLRSIRLDPIGESLEVPASEEATARRLERPVRTLRYRLTVGDADGLEALRYARRAMLREEWTLGLASGEPSLADALFSTDGVIWTVADGEQERCRAKLDALLHRANSALDELRGAAS